MSLPYAYTPQIWPSVFTVLLLIALVVQSGRRRSVPGASQFQIACLFAAVWVAGSGMEYAAVDVATKVLWVKFQACFQLPYSTAITFFFLEYAWPGRWLTRRNVILLSVFPLLALGLILTDDLHHLMWRSFAFEGSFAFNGAVIPQAGPAGWLFLAYGYLLGVVNIVVSAWLFAHSPQHRLPVVIMLTGLVSGRVVYLLEKVLSLHLSVPLDVLGITFAYLTFAIALFGFRLFDPVALAHLTLMEQISDGMLVLDPQERVASLNPAAEKIFGLPAGQIKGRPVREILPAYPEGLQPVTSGTEIEFSLSESGRASDYRLVISLLNDWRGQEVGRLLLLRDVTEPKRAQTQLLEQQRALSMLHEREQLARELHDSIGQVLGYTGLRIEAARTLMAAGKQAVADDQLLQLENILADAHADMREYILNLRTAPTGQPFFSALQQYLDGFLKNYGIRVDLSIGAGVEEGVFPPEAQMQLFRIIQEAFSNARKHAQADCLSLTFKAADGLVRIRIEDHGKGFDSTLAPGEGHFGLIYMRERAEALGGCLQVVSSPGEGTCVEVELPIGKDTETR